MTALPGSTADKANAQSALFSGLVKQVLDMQTFFGALPQDVDDLCRLMYSVTNDSENSILDWLRGCDRAEKLPRYDVACHGTRFEVGDLSPRAFTERLIWIVENQHGVWRLTCVSGGFRSGASIRGLILARDEDAVHYRLRWS